MKQTSFTVKNLGGNLPEKQSIIVKKSFRFSTKPLSLNSTISVDELTVETFYCFRTSELEEDVGCKVLHFINNEDQQALGYKTLRCKDAVASFRENKASVTFCICFPCILLCDGL